MLVANYGIRRHSATFGELRTWFLNGAQRSVNRHRRMMTNNMDGAKRRAEPYGQSRRRRFNLSKPYRQAMQIIDVSKLGVGSAARL